MKRVFEFLEQYREKLYLILISIIFVCRILDSTTIVNQVPAFHLVFSIIVYLSQGFLLVEIVADLIENKFKNSALTITFFALSMLVLIFTGNTSAFTLFTMIASAKRISFSKISNTIFYVLMITYAFVVFLGITNIIPNLVNYRDENTVRYALGFHYVLVPATLYLAILILRVYSKKGDLSLGEILAHIVIVLLLYFLTDSRCDLFLSALLLVGVLVAKFVKLYKLEKFIQSKAVKIICISLPAIIMVGSFLLLYLYSKDIPFAVKINSFLGNRLGYALKAIQEVGIPLFGSNFKSITGVIIDGVIVQPENYIFLDNSYFSILVEKGIVFLLFIVFIYSLVIKRCFDTKNYWLLGLIFIMLFQSFIEPYLIFYEYNVLLLAFWGVIYKNEENSKELNISYQTKNDKIMSKELQSGQEYKGE